jgi:nucleoid-associated protein YgaU
MDDSVISLKLADRTLYPVLNEGKTEKKRLILTPAQDNQSEVRLDLFREAHEKEAEYIGTISIGDIHHLGGEKPEIELVMSIDIEGNLFARARETISGDERTLSVHVGERDVAGDAKDANKGFEIKSAENIDDAPKNSLDDNLENGENASRQDLYHDQKVLQESFRSDAVSTYRENSSNEKKGSKAGMIVLAITLGILVILAAIVYISELQDFATVVEDEATVQGDVLIDEPQATQGETEVYGEATDDAIGTSDIVSHMSEKTTIEYTPKWGDTLWDLSRSFYGNPQEYGNISDANNIKNPRRELLAGKTIKIPNVDHESE